MVFINGSVGCTGKELGANGTGEQEPRKLGPPSRIRGLLCRQSASKALDAKPGGKYNAQRRHVCKPWGAARRAEVSRYCWREISCGPPSLNQSPADMDLARQDRDARESPQ